MLRLHAGDCLELFDQIEDGSVDAVICDPPYGTTRNAWDSVIPLDAMWAALRRIVKPRGPIVFTASQPFVSALVMSNPDWFRHEWIWHKNKASGHLNAKRAPMKAHESVLVFASGAPTYFPQMTGGHKPMNAYYTSHNGSNYGDGERMTGGGSTLRYPRSVLEFPVVNNDDPSKVHPTQKPLELMEYVVRTYTEAGEIVLDFAMGSGTTGVACRRLDRGFIGFESDPIHFANAEMRIKASNDNAEEFRLVG